MKWSEMKWKYALKWRWIPNFYSGWFSAIKCQSCPNRFERIDVFPFRFTKAFPPETDKLIIKFIWICKGQKIATVLKKNQVRKLAITNIKTQDDSDLKTLWVLSKQKTN